MAVIAFEAHSLGHDLFALDGPGARGTPDRGGTPTRPPPRLNYSALEHIVAWAMTKTTASPRTAPPKYRYTATYAGSVG